VAQFLLVTTLLTIAGLIATSIVGFMASPGNVAQHIMFALGTVVVGLFSQSMTMFFFIGTGTQLKDKTRGDAAEAAVRNETRSLTMKVSPAATLAMLVLMVTFITGGGVGSGKTPRWLHDLLTVATIVVYARAYWVEMQAMLRNGEMMQKYLSSD
jgi:amino acid transporter